MTAGSANANDRKSVLHFTERESQRNSVVRLIELGRGRATSGAASLIQFTGSALEIAPLPT